jgi:phosphoribosyl 1,2-cyclic phosphodiesterase
MIVTLYGTRGSISVASKETKKYGGNTTCLFVESKTGDPIVIDAGTGIRELGVHLMQSNKTKIHLIFTHYHWDHIQGFPFFAPLFSSKTTIEAYGYSNETTPEKALNYQMTLPYFPAQLTDFPGRVTFREIKNRLTIGSVSIETIVTNHPNYTLGLRFTEDKNSFVFLTDNELFAKNGNTPYEDFVRFVRGSNFFIHDAQYTDDGYDKKQGWGHSTHGQVVKLARDADVKNVIFTHHDHGSTDQFIDDIVKELTKKHPKINMQAAADRKTIILK